MAWIYLAESAASVSHLANGSTPSHTVSKTDTLRLYCYHAWQKASCTTLPYGTTCEVSIQQSSTACQLTLFLEDSPVRTSVLQDLESAWQDSAAVYSLRLLDWSKKSSPVSSSWKTCQPLELEVFEKSSVHLPKSGMTVGGLVYQPQALEHHTSESDGSYLPTPTASSYGTQTNPNALPRPSLETMARKNLWPTPTARDWKDTGTKESLIRAHDKRDSPGVALVVAKTTEASGQLSPMFVEWLMGYPIAWTELNASVTQWFRNKSEKRSKYSEVSHDRT